MATGAEQAAAFRAAVQREDIAAALQAARDMDYVGAGASLEPVRLLARKKDPRFDAAANRWVVEKSAGVGEISIATAAMSALAIDPDSERVIGALRAVMRGDV